MSDIIAVSGAKNSGKTTLIERLIKYYDKIGIKTAVIKHDGHNFTPDRESSDSRRFYDSGAIATAVFDDDKVQIVRRGEIKISEITEIFSSADIVFLEGFKYSEYPKIWMCSDEKFDNIKNMIAWIGECKNSPKFLRDDIEEIAEYILDFIRR